MALLATKGALAQDDAQARAWAASCITCHSSDARTALAIPKITGQSQSVLEQKLLAYKAGTLPATVMHQIVKGYSDEQLARIAKYLSQRHQ